MKKLLSIITSLGLLAAAGAQANTPLLVDPTDFSNDGEWIVGANQFVAGDWAGFATLEAENQVSVSGDSFTFSSWDDGTSDMIETFLFQEFFAGPSDSPWPNTLFATGDEIVFTGEASATRSGPNTGNMTVRAFVKMLGYNELGWEFQTKTAQSDFFPIGSSNEAFELRVTFPDLADDDSFQVLQVGFEITTQFSSGDMNSGTITFSNIDAHIVGDGTDPDPEVTYAGIAVDSHGNVDSGDFMGLLHVAHEPWVYVYDLSRWIYMPDPGDDFAGAWAFVLRPSAD
jgi:hypothetical protein